MKTRLVVATLVLSAWAANASPNFGFWAVNVLKTVYREPPAGGKFRAVTLNGASRVPASDLNGTFMRVVREIDAATRAPGAILKLLGAVFADEAFDCIVISDLEPHQIVAVEHFARAKRLPVISSSRDVGVVPFAIDDGNNLAYWRFSALKRYGLSPTDYAPRLELMSLDPIQCPPARAEQQRWSPERVCYANAVGRQASRQRGDWDAAIRELSVAIVIAPVEGNDHPAYTKGVWGRERYHPHFGMATFLSRFASCDLVDLELALSSVGDADKQDVRRDCASRRSLVRLEDPLGDLAAVVHVETQLLPPFEPGVDWRAFLALE